MLETLGLRVRWSSLITPSAAASAIAGPTPSEALRDSAAWRRIGEGRSARCPASAARRDSIRSLTSAISSHHARASASRGIGHDATGPIGQLVVAGDGSYEVRNVFGFGPFIEFCGHVAAPDRLAFEDRPQHEFPARLD